jgi:hypothetical protein
MEQTIVKSACKRVLSALAIGCLAASVALAHHGWTGYDEKQTLNLTGTIWDSGYENPHGFVRLEVSGSPAKTWMVILAPPSRMESRGLHREALKPGATAMVVGYPNRTNADEVRAERIRINGKTTELR